ncbi:MAG: transglycosylase domain-containing protein, partial [Flavobacteriales bacterium]|nr:transglycosylase domain-containing protein [Flavobacteriales bacterium]
LNQYDFLNQAVGIKSAAHVYFNTTPDSLNIQQSAMLVGMLKNSSLFNPLKRDSLVTKRREVVLKQMMRYNYLTEAQYDSLRVLPLGLDYQRVSHDEGLAPYFREVLRAEIDKILKEKDKNGNYIRQRSDGSPYDLYTDGLRVITTLDTRLQKYAEWAVEEHLSKNLQKEFTKNLSLRKKDKYPFYNGIADSDRERIMNKAIHQSERYQELNGELCPECKRPEHYIERVTKDGKHFFVCNSEKGGCGHEWHDVGEEGITENFNTPVKMRVYAHGGYKDTLMSPLDSIKYHKAILHASLMSVDPHTGHIKAWVGGIDFKYFKFDNAYQSRRQVGSTFKPLIYATALRNNDKPCTKYPNEKICIDLPTGAKWCPDNSEGGYGGNYTLTKALANSVNTISAKLISKYSPDAVISLGQNLGIKSKIPSVPSIALGVAELTLYEMVGANSAFVNNGVYIEPTFLLRIEDKNGNAIYEADPDIKQALDPTVAYELVKMMKEVVNGGTGSRLRSGRPYGNLSNPIAGKTGTTQNNTDGWFMGLTPDLVTGVWVGAQDPTVRFSSTLLGQGANTGLPIFGYYMNKVYADKTIDISRGDFPEPENYDPERFKCTGEVELFSEEDDLFNDEGEIPNGELGLDSDSPPADSLGRDE